MLTCHLSPFFQSSILETSPAQLDRKETKFVLGKKSIPPCLKPHGALSDKLKASLIDWIFFSWTYGVERFSPNPKSSSNDFYESSHDIKTKIINKMASCLI